MSVYKECNLLKTGTTVTLTNQKFDDLFQTQDLKIRNEKQFGFMWPRNDILRGTQVLPFSATWP